MAMAPDREGWLLRKKEIISTLTAHSQAVLQCCCAGHTPLIDLHCRLHRLGEDLASFPGCRCLKPSIIPGWRPSMLLTLSLISECQYTWPPDKHLSFKWSTSVMASHWYVDCWPVSGICSLLFVFFVSTVTVLLYLSRSFPRKYKVIWRSLGHDLIIQLVLIHFCYHSYFYCYCYLQN